ncbi:BCCT family transporter [Spirulina sp. CS-785/01]|uniref:BCCT family transporter n=1 Tax=Spirulina sp. CS-785/01 TaxID=3021716 RepID=UPI00232E4C48|nr:BCCT family transporter [Spirulina sp. CS-785/01]MDB9313187.1 BCCT family transporter [Spirulina sp. CS-785/01]
MSEPQFDMKGLQVELLDEDTGRYPGDTNIQKWGFDLHPQVSFISATLIAIFIILTLSFQEQASGVFSNIQAFVSSYGGWFFILVGNIYLGVMLILAFGKYSHIRLGGPDAKPEFSTFAWFAMLLSAGMGIGLMFWSVGEPIFHMAAPPFGGEAGTAAAAETAMSVTFFHWGFHPWGIYALVALALAFFAFNRGLPLTMRSVFYPLLGERIYDTPGNVIDILSVIATLFGLATSLGLGVGQVAAGLHFLIPAIPESIPFQVVLIAIITGFATMSVVAGLDGGVRRLSEFNLYIAGAFMVFVLLVGPTLFILDGFVQNLGNYIANFPVLSFWTETYEGTEWQNSWTVFYWGWWISWSPFVGMFIARVSKGRTVREFILGVLIIPTLLSFLWLTTFGNSALFLELQNVGDLTAAVNENVATAMFFMLNLLAENTNLIPSVANIVSVIGSTVGVLLVVTFFVTSSDSGSLVVDHLTSGGKLDSPIPQRVFWAVMEGVVAAVLLLGGGLNALQTAAITTGLPFAVVLLVMCFSLQRGLAEDLADLEAEELRSLEAEDEYLEKVPADMSRR